MLFSPVYFGLDIKTATLLKLILFNKGIKPIHNFLWLQARFGIALLVYRWLFCHIQNKERFLPCHWVANDRANLVFEIIEELGGLILLLTSATFTLLLLLLLLP